MYLCTILEDVVDPELLFKCQLENGPEINHLYIGNVLYLIGFCLNFIP